MCMYAHAYVYVRVFACVKACTLHLVLDESLSDNMPVGMKLRRGRLPVPFLFSMVSLLRRVQAVLFGTCKCRVQGPSNNIDQAWMEGMCHVKNFHVTVEMANIT